MTCQYLTKNFGFGKTDVLAITILCPSSFFFFLLFFIKNIVFLAEAEYSNFSADLRLKCSCEYFLSTAYHMSVFESK